MGEDVLLYFFHDGLGLCSEIPILHRGIDQIFYIFLHILNGIQGLREQVIICSSGIVKPNFRQLSS